MSRRCAQTCALRYRTRRHCKTEKQPISLNSKGEFQMNLLQEL